METKLLIIMAGIIVASGCAHEEVDSPTPPGGSESSKGLVVSEFRVADQQMTPGQESVIRLRLKNYHTQSIEIQDISLYNTGFLEVENNGCSPESIQPSRKNFAPEMECSWTVKAPEELDGFESKSVTLQLNLAYSSNLDNKQSPMKVQFKPLQQIEKRDQITHSFTNKEVKTTVSYEDPVPMEGGMIEFEFESAGVGRITSDYSISYQPSQVLDDCQNQVESIVGQRAGFTCKIMPDADSASQRNLVFSTSYKYVKSPSLDIEVVKP